MKKKGMDQEKVWDYQEGDYFGEIALLKDCTRQASIVAQTDCKVLSIDRATFKRLINNLDELQRRVEQYQNPN